MFAGGSTVLAENVTGFGLRNVLVFEVIPSDNITGLKIYVNPLSISDFGQQKFAIVSEGELVLDSTIQHKGIAIKNCIAGMYPRAESHNATETIANKFFNGFFDAGYLVFAGESASELATNGFSIFHGHILLHS